MKKGILTLSALGIWACSGQIQAKVNVCVFDLLGKAGESFAIELRAEHPYRDALRIDRKSVV